MANETLGASFSIDVTELKAGLAQANRLIRESESEFRAAAAGMDDWTKSQEGLEKRQKSLNTQIDLQKGKIENLVKQRELTIKKMEEEGKTAEEIAKATDAVNQAITRESKQLDKLKSELNKTEKALDEMGDSADEAADAVEEVGDAAEDAGDGFTITKGAIAGFISNGLSSLVSKCTDAIGSVLGLAESTKEFRTEMAKLESAFDSAGLGADLATKSYDTLYSVLGDTGKATEASMLIAQIAKDEQDLDKWNRILVGTWAQYGDSIPTEGLAEAISATSAMSSVQGVLADALEWQGINLDDFNERLGKLQTEEERAALIQETLTGLYGESADAYRENNAELIEANNAANALEKSQAELGETIEPITTKFTELKTKALQWLISDGLPALQNSFEWVKNNIPTIAALVGTLTAAWLTFGGVQKLIDTWNKIVAISQAALNAVMNANPIGLIITAVMGLVAAFTYLWNNCEGFRNFFIGMWEGIKKAFSFVVDFIKENWQAMLLFLMNPLAGVFKYCYDHFEGFRNFVDNVISSVKNFFLGLWNWVKSNWQSILLFIVNPFAGAFKYLYDNFEGFRKFVDKIVLSIKTFFVNLWTGIVNAYHTVIDPWIEIVKRLSAMFYEKVIQPIAKFFVDLWNGITSGLSAAWAWTTNLLSTVGTWIYDNVIKPVVDFVVSYWTFIIDGVKAGIQAIKDVFSTVAGWVNENVIQPVANFFSKLWSGFKDGAAQAWQGVKNIFSNVASFFGDIFQKAWSKVKEVFSAGGKVFDGIKDGIVTAFKTVVNALIRGLNKVVKLPFEGLNKILNKISGLSIAGVKPFEWLTWRAPIPNIPELATGGVVRKATTAIIGEDGAEAIIPLEKNKMWVKKVAAEMAAEMASRQPQQVVVNQHNTYAQAHSRYEIWQSEKNTASAVKLALMGG